MYNISFEIIFVAIFFEKQVKCNKMSPYFTERKRYRCSEHKNRVAHLLWWRKTNKHR